MKDFLNKMYLVLLGAPGAGKGTQAAVISKELKLPHLASGDLFRQAVQKGTKLGELVNSYMEKGALVPDNVTIDVISERLNEPDCSNGCVFDGFPRTLEQAKALDKVLGERNNSIDKAIYIDVSEQELMERLGGRWICRQCQAPYHEIHSPPKAPGKCDRCGGELYQRTDDNAETIRERLKVYFAQTTPVLDYYDQQGKLIRINGKLAIDHVSDSVLRALGHDKK
jgi:adenylate kinase